MESVTVKNVMHRAQALLREGAEARREDDMQEPLLNEVKLGLVGGTINRSEMLRLKKMIFRISRGKAATFFYDLMLDQNDNEKVAKRYANKNVFLVLFEDGPVLRQKICKVV